MKPTPPDSELPVTGNMARKKPKGFWARQLDSVHINAKREYSYRSRTVYVRLGTGKSYKTLPKSILDLMGQIVWDTER